jgi:outer membrane protein assembly factor BamB
MHSRIILPVVLTLLLTTSLLAADRKEEFLAAAKKGDAAAVRALLAQGVDVNTKSPYGVTALAYAADRGHLEVVKVLLEYKADVNAKDRFYSFTPLNWALMRGHAAIVKTLLQGGAKDAASALVSAAISGDAATVRAILEAGKAKPEELTKALEATPPDRPAVAELLRKAGAKPAVHKSVAVDRATLASYAGTYKIDYGAEVKILFEDGKLLASFADKQKRVLQAVDRSTFKLAGADGLTLQFRRDADKVSALALKRASGEDVYKRVDAAARTEAAPVAADEPTGRVVAPRDWPQFRGVGAAGIADGQFPPTRWDVDKNVNVHWKTPIPGLGHSCPVVWGDRVFVTTAVSSSPKTEFRPGLYGDVDSVKDSSEHTWRVYCLDRHSGKVLWDRIASKGVPKIKRHPKSSHANSTPAVDERRVVVCFGSEGLYCYDHDGNLMWRRDLGTLESGWFYDADYQWGFGSSPILYRDRVLVQCDVGKNSFVAAYDVETGNDVWRSPRDEVPSWGTPTVIDGPRGPELVTNATKFARGYDPQTGKELWRLGPNSEITVPTPFAGAGLVFVTSGYRPVQPIYAIRPGARGDLSLKNGKTQSDAIAWSTDKGGPYMPTPIVYGDYLYVCSNAGVVTCHDARTGKQVYKERLGGRGGYTASPVAADGRLYFTSEESGVRVVRAGPKFKLLAVNPVGEVCMATPAICDGMLYLRTQHHLIGVGRPVH